MSDYRRETPSGLGPVDSRPSREEDSKPSSGTAAEAFEQRARRIKESFSAMPAVCLPETVTCPELCFEENVALPAVPDPERITSVRRKSSTAVKTVVDLEPRFMPIRKAVDDILKPLSLRAGPDNGLRFYKVYIELCAGNRDFAGLLAEWLNDRIVRMKMPSAEKPEDFIIVNTVESDLDGMFPVVHLQKITDGGGEDAKTDKIPLLNVLPDLQY